jgi:hypothetical protein
VRHKCGSTTLPNPSGLAKIGGPTICATIWQAKRPQSPAIRMLDPAQLFGNTERENP